MRSKTEAALVRTDCAVELNAETAVDPYSAFVVYPRYTELNHSFRLDQPLKKTCFFIFGMLVDDNGQRLQNLFHRLLEFGLVGITFFDGFDYSIHIIAHNNLHLLFIDNCRSAQYHHIVIKIQSQSRSLNNSLKC